MPKLLKIFSKRRLQWALGIAGALCVAYWGMTAITGRGIRLTTSLGWMPCVVWVRESTGSLERFDPNKPFRVVLGRGSGWHGFDTMDIDSQGKAILHQMWHSYFPDTPIMGRWIVSGAPGRKGPGSGWETAQVQLTPDQCRQMGEAVSRYGMRRLKNSYSAAGVNDGTQWALRVFQGGQWKASYFDNYFPDASRDLARVLDKILLDSATPIEKWEWSPVSKENWRKHEKVLYEVQPGVPNF